MKREDAVLLLTDAATFKADITSYPAGMIFAVVVDLLEPNPDQLSELKELTTTSNTGKLRDADQGCCGIQTTTMLAASSAI